jgi:peptide/nickel transport system substrate-binding protein
MRIEKPKKSRLAMAIAMLSVATALTLPQIAGAETVLRIGMTAADIPRTLGQPDQGFEGNRFTGVTMYDGLTMWDLSSATKASVVIPGLATEWKVDDSDKKKWTFKLRPGVTFHDGSAFNADAVVWNVEKVLKQDALQFDASQVGVTASRMPTLVSAKKIDDMTVELMTKEPDSFLPINLTNLYMASPTKWQSFFDKAEGADAKAKSQAAWAAFAREPAGTGPWKMSKFTPRERLELAKNDNYWDKPMPALRRCCPARSTGSRRRRPMPSRKSPRAASRLRRTSSRMSGRGSSPASRARRGMISVSARPPISASTAKG